MLKLLENLGESKQNSEILNSEKYFYHSVLWGVFSMFKKNKIYKLNR